MAVKFKPIYICEGCSAETEDPDQVRIFSGTIVNGDGTKQFISSEKMYCLNCIPLALDFENVVPETVEIITEPQKNSIKPTESQLKDLDEIETDLSDIKQTYTKLRSIMENIINTNTLNDSRLAVIEEIILNANKDQEEHVYQEEPETPKEIIYSETKKDILDSLESSTSGKYLVLQVIEDFESEKTFAEKNGYGNLKNLQDVSGLKSLVGYYYSSDTYVNDLPKDFSKKLNIKLINKIIYGIPNIVSKEVYVNCSNLESKLAIIEKEHFVDKLEAVITPLPSVEKTKLSETEEVENLKNFGFREEVNLPPKKKFSFSKNSISNDYI